MEQFSYVKRGYSPEEVNKYIATLEQVIKSYKEKDNAIKNAIISAQVAADNVVRNAHMQAHEYKKKISQQLIQVSAAIDAERMRLQAFHDVYTGLMRKYLFEVETADMFEMSRRLDDMEKLIADLLEMDVPPTGDGTPLLPAHEGEVTPAPTMDASPFPAPDHTVENDAPLHFVSPEPLPDPDMSLQFASDSENTQEQNQDEMPPVAPPPRFI
ncbi:MAG: DivIVA domain-containing protein [Defluviitaleaceae bacterium]|nr:DivIVA domain-containing protein [Defluviitaleaceae bacterium]MCL2276107.1 DivIVA domain-containing protein [Defluviitaleaceae bacterium]